jgi:hypothetical protein
MKAIFGLTLILALSMLLMFGACDTSNDDKDEDEASDDDYDSMCQKSYEEELVVDDGTSEGGVTGTGPGTILLQGGYEWPELSDLISVRWFSATELNTVSPTRLVIYVLWDNGIFELLYRSEPADQGGTVEWLVHSLVDITTMDQENWPGDFLVGFEFESDDRSPTIGLDQSGMVPGRAWFFDGTNWLNLQDDLDTPGALMIRPTVQPDYDEDDSGC